MPTLTQVTPAEYHPNGDSTGPDMAQFAQHFLAQGDSWFSLGSLTRITNLLQHLKLQRSAIAVNCAQPGAKLSHMTDTTSQPVFKALLTERFGQKWDAVLISGGGNDIIGALGQSPSNKPAERLLLKPDEWTSTAGAARYLSEDGWKLLCKHLDEVMAHFFGHLGTDINRDTPVLMHTYDFATPRQSGVKLGPLKGGPWMIKACQAYGIPEADWPALSRELLTRWATQLQGYTQTYPQLRVVQTQGLLTPALTSDTGPTEDWENEIHPNKRGYRKLTPKWAQILDALPPR